MLCGIDLSRKKKSILTKLPVHGKRIEVVLVIQMPVFVYASKAKTWVS